MLERKIKSVYGERQTDLALLASGIPRATWTCLSGYCSREASAHCELSLTTSVISDGAKSCRMYSLYG